MNTACKALSFFLVEGHDLEIQVSHIVDSFQSVQETLDIYSVQDNILELKYTDKESSLSSLEIHE